MNRRSKLTVVVAALAALVTLLLPLSVTQDSSPHENAPQDTEREGFPGWLDANTIQAQRVLTGVGGEMNALEQALNSTDATTLNSARASARAAIVEASEFWQQAPPHDTRNAMVAALDAYLVAAGGAAVDGDDNLPAPPSDVLISAAEDQMVAAIEQVRVVAGGG